MELSWITIKTEKHQAIKRSAGVVAAMIYQFWSMIHFTHCTAKAHTVHTASTCDGGHAVFAVFFRALALCYDVDASCDHKGSISQAQTQEVTCQSSRGHVYL